MYFMFTMDTMCCEVHVTSVIYVNLPVKIISDTCLQFSSAENKYLDQHVHIHMLINAFAIPSAIMI